MTYISIGIIVSAVLTILFVMIQDRSSGTGGAFGGDVGGFYQRRRGMEKAIFLMTIVSITAFVGLSLFNLTSSGRVAAPEAPAGTNLPNVSVDAINGVPVEGDKDATGGIEVKTEKADAEPKQ